MHQVDTIHVGNREVKMESAATLVCPRLANKSCVLTRTRYNFFDCGLKQESSVGCIERFAVPKVDLVLRWAELVITGEYSDVELVEHAQQVQESSVRVNQSARCVNATCAT